MHRVLLFAFVLLTALTATALSERVAAADTGTITFTGHIVDPGDPLVPGSIVTVHGAVIARSESCIEARVSTPTQPRAAALWLCSSGAEGAARLPDVGKQVTARARITGLKATSTGTAPRSDSFILLDAG